MQLKEWAGLLNENGAKAARVLATVQGRTCRLLYIVGIQSVRILKRVRRRSARFFKPLTGFCLQLYFKAVGNKLAWLKIEFLSIRKGIFIARERIGHAKNEGFFHAVREFCFSFTKSFRLHRGFVFSLLNLAVPAACFLLLLFAVKYWTGLNFGLILENSGQEIAAIRDESVYEKATEMVNQRMVHDSVQNEAKLKFAPGFRLSVIVGGYSEAASICDSLIQQSNGIIEEASGLYMDGQLLGVVKSGADLRYMLQRRLNAAKGSDPSVTAQFTDNVEIINGLFPTTSIISADAMDKIINETSRSGVSYMVKDGDTVTSIAKANHMTVSQLNKLNNNRLGDSIRPGDLITLEVAVPRLGVELVKTVEYNVALPFKTLTQNDDTQYTDYSKVLTEGSTGTQKRIDKVHLVNGVETKRELVQSTVLKQPVDRVVITGTKKKPQDQSGISSGSLMWPVPALHEITTYFTWRWGKFHPGIDISGSSAYGRTIVAADGGVVVSAGWDGGYGNRVVIDHGNGISTLYGHASELLVSPGQRVSKGQPIARVGSTGNSTGPHCHFEVIKNGTKVNPLSYVG